MGREEGEGVGSGERAVEGWGRSGRGVRNFKFEISEAIGLAAKRMMSVAALRAVSR